MMPIKCGECKKEDTLMWWMKNKDTGEIKSVCSACKKKLEVEGWKVKGTGLF